MERGLKFALLLARYSRLKTVASRTQCSGQYSVTNLCAFDIHCPGRKLFAITAGCENHLQIVLECWTPCLHPTTICQHWAAQTYDTNVPIAAEPSLLSSSFVTIFVVFHQIASKRENICVFRQKSFCCSAQTSVETMSTRVNNKQCHAVTVLTTHERHCNKTPTSSSTVFSYVCSLCMSKTVIIFLFGEGPRLSLWFLNTKLSPCFINFVYNVGTLYSSNICLLLFVLEFGLFWRS